MLVVLLVIIAIVVILVAVIWGTYNSLVRLDERVYRSEMSNISRNRAIAYLLENKGVIQSDVERTLDFYVKMCSLSVTAESLAGFGLLLAICASEMAKTATGQRITPDHSGRGFPDQHPSIGRIAFHVPSCPAAGQENNSDCYPRG